jgi:Ca2+-transporting ATPase
MGQQYWYDNDIDHVIKQLDTSPQGLTENEARARLEKYGPNELLETGGINPLKMFLEQFRDPMVLILIVAIAISLITYYIDGEGLIDAIVILAIVIFNAIFGFVQEYKSEQALEALKQLAAPKARVMRDGLWTIIESRNIVPGDFIGFESGDLIPADARVSYAVGLGSDEAALTVNQFQLERLLSQFTWTDQL